MHSTSAVHTPKCSRSSQVGTCVTLELPDASARHRNIPEESLPEVSQHRRPSQMSDTVPSRVPGGRVRLRPRAGSAAFCGGLDPVGSHTLKAEEARKQRRWSDFGLPTGRSSQSRRALPGSAPVSSQDAPTASPFPRIRPGCQPSSHQPGEAARATRSWLYCPRVSPEQVSACLWRTPQRRSWTAPFLAVTGDRSSLLMCHRLDKVSLSAVTPPPKAFSGVSTFLFTGGGFYEGSFPLKAHKHVNT